MASHVSGSSRRRQLALARGLIGLGVVLCLVPLVSDLVARAQARRQVEVLSSTAEAATGTGNDRLLEQAHAYNQLLAGAEPDVPLTELWPYERQLDARDGTGAMAWIEIPRAGILLPVFHGDDEAVLAQGVGHWQMSSLPVGGESTHCWLTGHSGMQSSSLFDAIRVLEAGDVIGLHAAGEDLAYRVTGWRIVDPSEVADASISQGDLLTLVTCTTTPDALNPKGRVGVNDKRLLVEAERCPYDAEEFSQAADVAASDLSLALNEHTWQAAVAAVTVIALVGTSAALRAARTSKTRKAA